MKTIGLYQGDILCCLYDMHEETAEHMFFECEALERVKIKQEALLLSDEVEPDIVGSILRLVTWEHKNKKFIQSTSHDVNQTRKDNDFLNLFIKEILMPLLINGTNIIIQIHYTDGHYMTFFLKQEFVMNASRSGCLRRAQTGENKMCICLTMTQSPRKSTRRLDSDNSRRSVQRMFISVNLKFTFMFTP